MTLRFIPLLGVATFVRDSYAPLKYEEGITGLLATGNEDIDIGCYGDHTTFTHEELEELDAEGRVVLTQHQVNKYVTCDPKNMSSIL